ncbi:MAG TPA: hypothetical protein DD979_17795 [Gammaproteobacteria bacterium]|jgi:phasin family protein|nr:hypothetical protein [Gammaproteobacteria bacterium]
MTPTFDVPNAEEIFAPYKALSDLALANAEKLVSLQSKNFLKYSNVVIANLKEAAQCTDMDQSREFFEKQADLSKQVAEDFSADMKEVAEIGQAYAVEVQKLFSENAEKVTAAVQQSAEPAKKPRARTAPKKAA